MAKRREDSPVLDLMAQMTKDSVAATHLDDLTVMRVRLAALIAADAPPASYLLNLHKARELGMDAEGVREVLLAVGPIVGTTRLAAALGNIARALHFAIDRIEMDDEATETAGSAKSNGR
jgi:hypothetical protein